MARTVDPARHEQRRLVIIDAALTCFAALGYDGATTAAICREARIGSGTFFHYFPTKSAVLVALLQYGTGEVRDWFAARSEEESPRGVIDSFVRQQLDDTADPRLPGFVRAVSAVMGEPEVAAALAADEAAQRGGLEPWVARAQRRGQVRADLDPERLTTWVLLLIDGFIGRLATDPGFTVAREGAALRDAVDRLLAG